jgi:predicted lipoprotein with Yx(FWY)xxD motif
VLARCTALLFCGVVCLAVAASGGCASVPRPDAAIPEWVAPLATPPGITLRATRGTINAAGNPIAGPTAYADAAGHLIYVVADGSRAPCRGACASDWQPVAAPHEAVGFGDWSIVSGDRGARQWSFKGLPLYTRADLADRPDYARCHLLGLHRVEPEGDGQTNDGRCVALFEPAVTLALPTGIAVRELPNASAQALVDGTGMTLYALDDASARASDQCPFSACTATWLPLIAPEMASPVGDFSIVARSDRTRQWAFRGRSLFTFSGDTAAGDCNGMAANPHARVVAVARYFTPPEVRIAMTPGFGTIWTTASGMTLYSQNRGSKNRNPSAPNPRVVCDAECRRVWRALPASKDAVASGYWTPVPQPDGTRQWAYRGHLLFSYALDTEPGDMKGEYLYEYLVRDDSGAVTQIDINVSPTDRPWFWRPAFPY